MAGAEEYVRTSPEDRAKRFIDHVRGIRASLKEQAGLPMTLKEVGVSEDKLPLIAETAVKDGAAYYNRLKACGVHAEIEIYQGKPHAWFNKEPDRTVTLKRMEKFLVEQLNLKVTRRGDSN